MHSSWTCVGLLATSGVTTWAFWPSDSALSGVPQSTSTDFTPTTPYESSGAYNELTTDVSTTTEVGSSTISTTLPYSSSTPALSTTTKSTPTISTTQENQKEECYHGTIDIQYVECLIRNKSDLDDQNQFSSKRTILMISAENHNIDIAKLLIKNGANKDIKDFSHRTALIHAIINDSIGIAELLINEKADLNIQDINRKTALTYARERGYNNLVELLRKEGAVEGEAAYPPAEPGDSEEEYDNHQID